MPLHCCVPFGPSDIFTEVPRKIRQGQGPGRHGETEVQSRRSQSLDWVACPWKASRPYGLTDPRSVCHLLSAPRCSLHLDGHIYCLLFPMALLKVTERKEEEEEGVEVIPLTLSLLDHSAEGHSPDQALSRPRVVMAHTAASPGFRPVPRGFPTPCPHLRKQTLH